MTTATRGAAVARWKAKNREKVKAINAGYRERNPEKVRETQNASARKRYHADEDFRTQDLTRKAVRREANREYYRQYGRDRYKADPSRYRMRNAIRRAQLEAGEYVNILEVFEANKWVCQLCGDPVDPNIAWPDPMMPSLDHILPLSKGGTHDRSNVQLTHLGCNMIKGARV
jgi:5-methylcytosine-specific restriction endonuclease McrA